MHGARIAESRPPFKIGNQLYNTVCFRQLSWMNLKKFLLFLPVILLAGCTTPTFTRLTPNVQPRNANNLYHVETIFESNQQSLRWESVKAYVLVNGQLLPLRPVPMVKNRWEGFVPVPAGVASVNYRFKFDYLYNNFGTEPQPNSVSSQGYTLKIVD
jgi:hypothetical protein